MVIRVKNLYKIYRVGDIKVRALDGLDFDIYKGEFVAIGASGSGKSTPSQHAGQVGEAYQGERLRLAESI